MGIEVDPDGLEDGIKRKADNQRPLHVTNPKKSVQGTKELNLSPRISIFDIYNYLMTFEHYDHETLKDYQKWKAMGYLRMATF